MPGKEDTYHWALITGPKVEKAISRGQLYHAKNGATEGSWVIESRATSLLQTNALLTRLLVGKIADRDRVKEILCGVPATSNNPEWNCVIWIKEALEALQQDSKAMGTSVLDWQAVRDAAMGYVQKKRDQGRWKGESALNLEYAPTYDLLEKKETIE